MSEAAARRLIDLEAGRLRASRVRARKPGNDLLAGVSTRRLVPLSIHPYHGRYEMLLLLLLVLVVLAIGGGIVISKFLFLLLVAVLLIAVFTRLGRTSH
jgi:hypothetical protein